MPFHRLTLHSFLLFLGLSAITAAFLCNNVASAKRVVRGSASLSSPSATKSSSVSRAYTLKHSHTNASSSASSLPSHGVSRFSIQHEGIQLPFDFVHFLRFLAGLYAYATYVLPSLLVCLLLGYFFKRFNVKIFEITIRAVALNRNSASEYSIDSKGFREQRRIQHNCFPNYGSSLFYEPTIAERRNLDRLQIEEKRHRRFTSGVEILRVHINAEQDLRYKRDEETAKNHEEPIPVDGADGSDHQIATNRQYVREKGDQWNVYRRSTFEYHQRLLKALQEKVNQNGRLKQGLEQIRKDHESDSDYSTDSENLEKDVNEEDSTYTAFGDVASIQGYDPNVENLASGFSEECNCEDYGDVSLAFGVSIRSSKEYLDRLDGLHRYRSKLALPYLNWEVDDVTDDEGGKEDEWEDLEIN